MILRRMSPEKGTIKASYGSRSRQLKLITTSTWGTGAAASRAVEESRTPSYPMGGDLRPRDAKHRRSPETKSSKRRVDGLEPLATAAGEPAHLGQRHLAFFHGLNVSGLASALLGHSSSSSTVSCASAALGSSISTRCSGRFIITTPLWHGGHINKPQVRRSQPQKLKGIRVQLVPGCSPSLREQFSGLRDGVPVAVFSCFLTGKLNR